MMGDFWDFNDGLSRRLVGWGLLSMGVGFVCRGVRPWWDGFGMQFFTWGLIDALLGWFGWRGTAEKRQRPEAEQADLQVREATKLRRLLWFNAGLDVFYTLGGLWLVYRKGEMDEKWRGHGWGVIVQAVFLFFFDAYHAMKTPRI